MSEHARFVHIWSCLRRGEARSLGAITMMLTGYSSGNCRRHCQWNPGTVAGTASGDPDCRKQCQWRPGLSQAVPLEIRTVASTQSARGTRSILMWGIPTKCRH